MKLIFLFVFLDMSSCFTQVTSNHVNVKGRWKAVKIFPGNFKDIDEMEANKVIGQYMILSDSLYEFNGLTFINPTIDIQWVRCNDYFPIYRTTKGELGIVSDSMMIINVSDPIKRTQDLLILDGSRMIGLNQGWFVYLKKER